MTVARDRSHLACRDRVNRLLVVDPNGEAETGPNSAGGDCAQLGRAATVLHGGCRIPLPPGAAVDRAQRSRPGIAPDGGRGLTRKIGAVGKRAQRGRPGTATAVVVGHGPG
jgi:hypothetical protein